MEGAHTLMSDQIRVDVDGLADLTRALRGPAFKDVNRQLRASSRAIAAEVLLPLVRQAVAASGAPQAGAMADTVRVHSDRVPVVVVGKVNPRFTSGFRRGKGGGDGSARASKMRRGSLARGVVMGPLGGRRDTPATENYYRIGRDPSGGALGRALRDGGTVAEAGTARYLAEYVRVLRGAGFDVDVSAV